MPQTLTSISFSRKDADILEIAKAICHFYNVKGVKEKGKFSRVVAKLTEDWAHQEMKAIKKEYGVDIRKLMREILPQTHTMEDLMFRKLNRSHTSEIIDSYFSKDDDE